MSVRRLLLPCGLLLLLSGCGYFNSLYNARRQFAEAERASRRGEVAAARTAYGAALDKAAVSYRRYPTGRWADDALFLIGRARFGMGDYEAAGVALQRLLEQSGDRDIRTGAQAYLGAALVRLEQPDSAVAMLDTALATAGDGSEIHRFARLWRGRALLALEQPRGWEDLAAVTGASEGYLALEAGLETAARGLQLGDSVRAADAIAGLTRMAAAAPRADSIGRLLAAAADRWPAGFIRARLADDPGARWPVEARTRIRLQVARLSAQAGDTVAAVQQGRQAASLGSGPASSEARVATAGWLLGLASTPADLAPVRAVLLPAYSHSRAVSLLRELRVLEELLDLGRSDRSGALFAAAEYARDVLRAPRLAQGLFLAHADAAPEAPSAPKALLAALALTADGAERESLLARVRSHAHNPYVRALDGSTDAGAYAAAEEQLGRAIAAARAEAEAAAAGGDLNVARAAAVRDSLRLAALNDSMRVACGALLDSLALGGIRADSVRSACLRADSTRVRLYLGIDTTELRDTARVDSARAAPADPDTMARESR